MRRIADIVGSIACIVCFAVACFLAYAGVWSHQNGIEGSNLAFYGVAILLSASLLTGFAVWRSIRRTPK
jgi:hypothetical protein